MPPRFRSAGRPLLALRACSLAGASRWHGPDLCNFRQVSGGHQSPVSFAPSCAACTDRMTNREFTPAAHPLLGARLLKKRFDLLRRPDAEQIQVIRPLLDGLGQGCQFQLPDIRLKLGCQPRVQRRIASRHE